MGLWYNDGAIRVAFSFIPVLYGGMKMNRAMTLYRVSTKKQYDNQKDDIPMQRTACREFAERNNWIIVKEYLKKGVSGFKVSANDRDAVLDLKEASQRKEFNCEEF